MVVKSDQESVRALLSEAVRILCKNRLKYKAQLNIEGLIGITIDTDDIFLVNIKETIESEEFSESGEFINNLMSSTLNGGRPGRQRKSTPRHLSVVTSPVYQDPEDQECTWQLADGTDIEDLSPLDLAQLSAQKRLSPNNNTYPMENGTDAPLNLSTPASKDRDSDSIWGEELPDNLATSQNKRKRLKKEEMDENYAIACKRPFSNSPIPPMFIKQEPLSTSSIPTNGPYMVPESQPCPLMPRKACTPPSLFHDKRSTPARTNHLESIIWQRLSAAVNPVHMSTPLISSQDLADSITSTSSRSSSPSELPGEPPVLKVPLYSISGKLKKEKCDKPAANTNNNNNNSTTKDASVPTKDKLLSRESNANNTENMAPKENIILPKNIGERLMGMDMKALKKVESKFMNGGHSDFEALARIFNVNHEGTNNNEVGVDSSHNSSSDGYHSFMGDSADQENMEVMSVDSDEGDNKTENFILKSQEPGKAVSYKCKLCDRVYSNKWNCRRHIQYTHMNKTGFTCEICHNKYRDRSDYQEHMMVIHQGPGGYKCDFCDKILMSKRSLKEHVSLHTGQYRYHCAECARGFNRLNDYQLHMTKDHGTPISSLTGTEMAQFIDSSQKAVLPEPIIP